MEPTTRRRERLTSVMRSFTCSLTISDRSAPLGLPVWEAGTNTRMPLTLTTMPPLFTSVTVPSRMVFSSTAASMVSQFFTLSRRFLDRVATPSTSLTRMT